MYKWNLTEQKFKSKTKRQHLLDEIMKIYNKPHAIRWNDGLKQVEIHGEPADFDHLTVDMDIKHGITMDKKLCKELFTYLAKNSSYKPKVLRLLPGQKKIG